MAKSTKFPLKILKNQLKNQSVGAELDGDGRRQGRRGNQRRR